MGKSDVYLGEDTADSSTQFYRQSKLQVSNPRVKPTTVAVSPTDPNIFAVYSNQSEGIKVLDIYEFACYEDYNTLTRLRLDSYCYMLKQLCYMKPDRYAEYRRKLLEVYPSCQASSCTALDHIISKLKKNEPFKPEDDVKQKSEEKQYDDYGNEVDYGEEEEVYEETYEEYFGRSYMSDHYCSETHNRYLVHEELKWEKRAKWIEEEIQAIYKDPELKNWC